VSRITAKLHVQISEECVEQNEMVIIGFQPFVSRRELWFSSSSFNPQRGSYNVRLHLTLSPLSQKLMNVCSVLQLYQIQLGE